MKLEPMLVRLEPEDAERLRALARKTRIHQGQLLRDAVADLLAKWEAKVKENKR